MSAVLLVGPWTVRTSKTAVPCRSCLRRIRDVHLSSLLFSLFRGRWATWQPAPLRSGFPVALRAPFVFSASLSPALYTWPRATAGAPLMTYVTTSTLMLPAESHHLRVAGITLLRQFVFGSLLGASTDVVFVVVLLISDRLLFLCQPALGSRTRLRSRTLGAVKSTF